MGKRSYKSPGRLVKPVDVKGAILTGGNVFAAVFEVISDLQDGSELMPAVKKAITKSQRRAKKLKEAEEEV